MIVMLRKLIAIAVTSGLAAKLYRHYMDRQQKTAASSLAPKTRRRRAGTQA
jgi:Tfp pilus assembly major pilin PilA